MWLSQIVLFFTKYVSGDDSPRQHPHLDTGLKGPLLGARRATRVFRRSMVCLILLCALTVACLPVPLLAQPPSQPSKEYIYVGGRLIAIEVPTNPLAPHISGPLVPSSGQQGNSVNLTINGTNLSGASSVNFTPATGITTNITSSSATQVAATVIIASSAAAGPYNVSVTTSNGTSETLPFTVTSTSSATVTSLSPSSATQGTTVTLTVNGTNLSGATSVNFSPSSGISASAPSSTATQVTASVVIGSSAATGSYSVTVTTPNGTSGSLSFTVNPSSAPALTSMSPISGRQGTTVTLMLNGTNLTGATSVDFSPSSGIGTSISSFTDTQVNASVTINANATPGSRSVSVTTPNGSTGALSFTVTSPSSPTITAVTPNSGPVSGGTQIVITGAGFQPGVPPGTIVLIGASPATNVVVMDSTLISARTPAGTGPGARNVCVYNPDGGSVCISSAFTYNPPPTITNLTVTSGPTGGGTGLTVNGSGFLTGATVAFGGVAATVGTITASSIPVTTPAHVLGAVSVVVTNPDGQAVTLPNGFTYVPTAPAPTITSLTVTSGPISGGTATTINGNNYQSGAVVTLGGTTATVGPITATTIAVTTPGHSAGPVTIVVINPDGQTVSLASGYTYASTFPPPSVSAINPASGINTAPVNIASITGSNFAVGWDKENGLVGNWRMDETGGGTMADSSGNSNSGTATGTTIVTGKIGNGRSFNGTSDYVNLGNPANMNFNDTASYSIAFWVKSSLATPTGQDILSKDNIAGDQRIHFYINNGTIWRWAGLGGPTISSSDGWMYVVYTYSASGSNNGTETFYKNGVQVSTRTGAMPAPQTSTNWNLGRTQFSSGSWYFSGSLDEVRFYNRTLTPTEVSQLGVATGPGSVTLTRSGQPTISCSGFVYSNSTTLSNGACNITGSALGAWNVVVTNPDQQSGPLTNGFTTIVPPAPTVTSISPTSGTTNGGTAITITGTGFLAGPTVSLGGTAATNVGVASSTSITATTPAHAAGAVTVVVTNTDSQSGPLSSGYTYTNPVPQITTLSPSSVTAGSAAFNLTVTGSGFVNGSVVRVNGSDRSTTFTSSTQLSVSIPATDVASPASLAITVFNPTPGGGLSNSATLTVMAPNPVPSISSISPSSVAAGSATFTLTVNGANFIGASVVQVNGNNRTTTFANSSQINAQIPSSDVTTTGSRTITVFNPAPGGGTSNAATLTVTPATGGLKGEYFNNISLSGSPTLTRTDPTVNFSWGNGSPDPALPSDNFSVRWSGQVQAQFSERYAFYTTTDDGVRLWVNGALMIDQWVDQGPTAWSRSITLTANQKYNITMEYYEHTGGAVAQLSWMGPSTPYQIVPQSALTPTLGALVPGTGIGLTGNYFDNGTLLDPPYLTNLDPTINFNWGNGSPYGLPIDNFSIRWTGQVEPQFSETYTFYAKTNDGPRLWVNGQQIVNHWTSTTTQEWTGTIALTANQRYSIKLEYHETTGTAQAQLSWSSPSTPKQIIPQNRLYP